MAEKVEVNLRDGTVVRHKTEGYQGQIEGTTSIKECFTRRGESLSATVTKETFQYRILVVGQSMRQVAPLEDLEVMEAAAQIDCIACHKPFQTKPGLVGKPCGRCACGGWICPMCMSCQGNEATQKKETYCIYQRKRLSKKRATDKKASR